MLFVHFFPMCRWLFVEVVCCWCWVLFGVVRCSLFMFCVVFADESCRCLLRFGVACCSLVFVDCCCLLSVEGFMRV